VANLPFELPDLARALRELIAQVPSGRVTTCGALARALGNPVAARWVGHFTLNDETARECPVHRVVRAGGQLGGMIGGDERTKARRLAREGVEVGAGLVDLERFGFDAFRSERPLEKLREVQEQLAGQATLRARRRLRRLVGGVDVAYPGGGRAAAAYALVDRASGELVYSKTVMRRVTFPYITTYLAFRELPVLLALLDEVRAEGRLGEVVLVDGSGMLHPRQAGIATHLGVVAGLPTVGVTKKLLCGRVDIEGMAAGESRPVVHEERPVGVALRPTAGSRRPIFISPGHRVDLAFAERLVRELLCGHRLPEPLHQADRLSRVAARGASSRDPH
jgi:deoxyribonuclease V